MPGQVGETSVASSCARTATAPAGSSTASIGGATPEQSAEMTASTSPKQVANSRGELRRFLTSLHITPTRYFGRLPQPLLYVGLVGVGGSTGMDRRLPPVPAGRPLSGWSSSSRAVPRRCRSPRPPGAGLIAADHALADFLGVVAVLRVRRPARAAATSYGCCLLRRRRASSRRRPHRRPTWSVRRRGPGSAPAGTRRRSDSVPRAGLVADYAAQSGAGMRTEPAVSVPIASGTTPAPTAAPAPALEPPVSLRRVARVPAGPDAIGRAGAAVGELVAVAEPDDDAPAARRRRTTSASPAAIPSIDAEPQRYGRPSTSTISFTSTGTPASAPLLDGTQLPGLAASTVGVEVDDGVQLGRLLGSSQGLLDQLDRIQLTRTDRRRDPLQRCHRPIRAPRPWNCPRAVRTW